MSSLKTRIQSCEHCPLYKNMEVSPIASEWIGKPEIMIVVGTAPKKENDFAQEVITGVDRFLLNSMFAKHNLKYYMTFLTKCIGATKVSCIRTCVRNWISEELGLVKPKLIIGMGSNVEKYLKCDYYLPSPSVVFANKANQEKLEGILDEYKKQ